MKIYTFASDTLTNIWAGIGAGVWAVGLSDDRTFSKGRLTKAAKMPIGAFGILYCNETGAFITPFVVYSRPEPDRTVRYIWSGAWVLPFKIKPLCDPTHSMTVPEMKTLLPSVTERNISNPLTQLIRVQGNFAFQSSTFRMQTGRSLLKSSLIRCC